MLLIDIRSIVTKMGRPFGRPVFLVLLIMLAARARADEVHPLARGVVVSQPDLEPGWVFNESTENIPPDSQPPAGKGFLRHYGCVTCHDLALPPFRKRPGPDLTTVGAKSSLAWLDAYLQDPAAVQPRAAMPRIPLTEEDRADILALLVDRAGAFPPPAVGDVERGRSLFLSNECSRCHEKSGEGGRQGPVLDRVGEKLKPGWMVAYLRNPSSLVGNTTMPLFEQLDDEQIADIVAYLLHETGKLVEGRPNVGSPATGLRVFSQLGCANCHRIDRYVRPLDLPPDPGVDDFLRAHETREPLIRLEPEVRRAMADALRRPEEPETVDEEAWLKAFWVTPISLQGSAPVAHDSLSAELSPDACATCHVEQHEAWSGSLHGRAMGPGVFGQIEEAARSDPDFAASCRACHAPNAEQALQLSDGQGGYAVNYQHDPSLERRGITCIACHVRGHTRFGPVSGPRPPVAALVSRGHGGGHEAPVYGRSEFCTYCHQFEPDGRKINGKLLQDTFSEWESSPQAEEGLTCQGCHMPARAHTWKGIHDPETVRAAITLTVTIAPSNRGHSAVIEVTNTGAGHHLPTYVTPKLFVEAAALDSSGGVLVGSGEIRAIGRQIVLTASREEELYDTRIPAGGTWSWTYDVRDDRSRAVRVRIDVHPDHFYRDFFTTYDRSSLSRSAETMIDSALATAEGTPFRLLEQVFPVP